VVGGDMRAVGEPNPLFDRDDLGAEHHPVDHACGLRREKLGEPHRRKAEMQPAVADELRMHAQQRRGRAALERHVHHRERGERPEPFDHRLADAEGAQIVEGTELIELRHIVFTEAQRAPRHAVVRREVA